MCGFTRHVLGKGIRAAVGALTEGIYHIAVRAKFTTLTVGSADIFGTNCALRGSTSRLGRRAEPTDI
jgi:hypothetical protein